MKKILFIITTALCFLLANKAYGQENEYKVFIYDHLSYDMGVNLDRDIYLEAKFWFTDGSEETINFSTNYYTNHCHTSGNAGCMPALTYTTFSAKQLIKMQLRKQGCSFSSCSTPEIPLDDILGGCNAKSINADFIQETDLLSSSDKGTFVLVAMVVKSKIQLVKGYPPIPDTDNEIASNKYVSIRCDFPYIEHFEWEYSTDLQEWKSFLDNYHGGSVNVSGNDFPDEDFLGDLVKYKKQIYVRIKHGDCGFSDILTLSPRLASPGVSIQGIAPTCPGATDGKFILTFDRDLYPDETLEISVKNSTTYEFIEMPDGGAITLDAERKYTINDVAVGTYEVHGVGKFPDTSYETYVGHITGKIATIPANTNTPVTFSLTGTNVSCKDGNNGAVNVTVSGGTQPYTAEYGVNSAFNGSVSLTSLSGAITDLQAGVYNVRVKDSYGCYSKDNNQNIIVNSQTITQPATSVALNITESNEPSGYGLSNGSITVSASGGTPGYTYTLVKDNQQGTPTTSSTGQFTALSAGNYDITVTDSKGCTAPVSFPLTQPALLVATIQQQAPITCYGSSDGELKVNISGGVADYTVTKWEKFNGTTWVAFGGSSTTVNGLSTGKYRIFVKDANNNTATSAEFTLNQPTQLKITGFTQQQPLCYGNSNGWAQVQVSGGTTPYNYQWVAAGSPTTQRINNLQADSYTVIVKDANQCNAIGNNTVIINQPTQLSATYQITLPSAYNATDGSISVTPTGGTPSYTYLWTHNNATTNPLTSVAANDTPYSVKVSDSKGCNVTLNPRVIYPLAVQISLIDSISCFGRADGTLKAIATGGVGTNYSYQWYKIDGNTDIALSTPTSTLNNVAEGVYKVNVTDAENNTVLSTNFVFNQPAQLSATSQITLPSAYNATDGSISVTATGGTQPYTYLWAHNSATTSSITNLLATGSYFPVTVTDRRGCTVSLNPRLIYPLAVQVSLIDSITCFGRADGTLKATATGGVITNYTYQWYKVENGTDIALSTITSTLNNVAEGVYKVKATDAENNTALSSNFVFNQPTQLSATSQITLPSAPDAADGSISVTATGGTQPYAYLWAHNSATTSSINNLAATGSYFPVTVTDKRGCTVSLNPRLIYPLAVQVSLIDSISCFGRTDGKLAATASGGIGTNYSYRWYKVEENQLTDLFVSNAVLTNVAAGVYRVKVIDEENSNAYSQDFVFNQPDNLAATYQITLPTAYNATNGSIQVTATGGTQPYTYLWAYNNSTNSSLTQLPARDEPYAITVTDKRGCTTTIQPRIIYPLAVTIALRDSISCYETSTGRLATKATGGVGTNYQYSWYKVKNQNLINLNVADTVLTNVSAGVYRVKVIDVENNEAYSSDFILNQPDSLEITFTQRNLKCKFDADGWIKAQPHGGIAPYTYLWSTNATTAQADNLQENTYTVKVIDNRGCVTIDKKSITAPDELKLTINHTNPRAYNYTDASVWVKAKGGTGNYTYGWEGRMDAVDSLSNIGHGVYTATVTDANGCSKQITDNVPNPMPLIANVVATQVISCNGRNDGELSAISEGGVGNHSYRWYRLNTNNNYTELTQGDILSNLYEGIYRVKVTDDNGITAYSPDFTLTQPNVLKVIVNANSIACNGDTNGWVEAQVTGGTLPYSYRWTTGDNTQRVENLTDDKYLVFVTDAHGCEVKGQGEITVPQGIVVEALLNNPVCAGNTNGSIQLMVSGGVAPYSYLWSNGNTTTLTSKLAAGKHTVKVTDAKGCFKNSTYTLNNPAPITFNLGSDRTLCKGQKAELNATLPNDGGYAVYRWYKNNQPYANTPMITLTEAGLYKLEAIDKNGCKGDASIRIISSTDEVVANFAMASKAPRGEPVKLVNTSHPAPQTTQWLIPEDDNVEVVNSDDTKAEIIFYKNGHYTIGLRSVQGACEQYLYKTIEIIDKEGFTGEEKPKEAFLKKFIVYPNPNNGLFTVSIELSEKADIRLRLINMLGTTVKDEKASGKSTYEIKYDVTNIKKDVYILQFISEKATSSIKIIID